jgi:hypothetical protein
MATQREEMDVEEIKFKGDLRRRKKERRMKEFERRRKNDVKLSMKRYLYWITLN